MTKSLTNEQVETIADYALGDALNILSGHELTSPKEIRELMNYMEVVDTIIGGYEGFQVSQKNVMFNAIHDYADMGICTVSGYLAKVDNVPDMDDSTRFIIDEFLAGKNIDEHLRTRYIEACSNGTTEDIVRQTFGNYTTV